ncbi:MAG: type II toxin-antitoxin system RelB/DinJ family antitoxin [Mucispirillum sp.]|nr:type II toxin-antitoxin system RelB/DinJ family antitoxin [Mucispirillum sp.]
MEYSKISVRIDTENKKAFDKFCSDVGLSASSAISLFIKTVLRENRIPFEISSDPFYSKTNIEHLKRGVNAINNGYGKVHELIEAD